MLYIKLYADKQAACSGWSGGLTTSNSVSSKLHIYLFIIKATNVGEYNSKCNIGKIKHIIHILRTVNPDETIHSHSSKKNVVKV